ncbi:MAG: hypothetical protein QOK28_3544 [Actinomycetota bacterium]
MAAALQVLGIDRDEAEELLSLVDREGTSEPGLTVEELLADNRAGPNETHLTLDEVLRRYAALPDEQSEPPRKRRWRR